MRRKTIGLSLVAALLLAAAAALAWFFLLQHPHRHLAGMPATVHPENLYSEAGANRLSAPLAYLTPLVFVPEIRADEVSVIDPNRLRVIARFPAGRNPQHVVPSYDLKSLWVAGSAAPGRGKGSLMPIDAISGKPGRVLPVADAYNLYFTPDGQLAIDVAEEDRRLDLRDPQTMRFRKSVRLRECAGANHADFDIDGQYMILSCEFDGHLVKLELPQFRVVKVLSLPLPSMPQDVRVGPDGKLFYVADMMRDGVFLIDGDSLTVKGFIHTGVGTHGLAVSRDGRHLYVTNRGSHVLHGPRHGPGSVSVIDFGTNRVARTWPIPGGGSPDMGNISADGRYLWVSGRFDDVVYRIDTATGHVVQIAVGKEPHGLTIWPQPGRYSLGHTGIMR
jgi:DNA-binding beta-propeller fold protein YncE